MPDSKFDQTPRIKKYTALLSAILFQHKETHYPQVSSELMPFELLYFYLLTIIPSLEKKQLRSELFTHMLLLFVSDNTDKFLQVIQVSLLHKIYLIKYFSFSLTLYQKQLGTILVLSSFCIIFIFLIVRILFVCQMCNAIIEKKSTFLILYNPI